MQCIDNIHTPTQKKKNENETTHKKPTDHCRRFRFALVYNPLCIIVAVCVCVCVVFVWLLLLFKLTHPTRSSVYLSARLINTGAGLGVGWARARLCFDFGSNRRCIIDTWLGRAVPAQNQTQPTTTTTTKKQSQHTHNEAFCDDCFSTPSPAARFPSQRHCTKLNRISFIIMMFTVGGCRLWVACCST